MPGKSDTLTKPHSIVELAALTTPRQQTKRDLRGIGAYVVVPPRFTRLATFYRLKGL